MLQSLQPLHWLVRYFRHPLPSLTNPTRYPVIQNNCVRDCNSGDGGGGISIRDVQVFADLNEACTWRHSLDSGENQATAESVGGQSRVTFGSYEASCIWIGSRKSTITYNYPINGTDSYFI
jgi:hypothetical protein